MTDYAFSQLVCDLEDLIREHEETIEEPWSQKSFQLLADARIQEAMTEAVIEPLKFQDIFSIEDGFIYLNRNTLRNAAIHDEEDYVNFQDSWSSIIRG